MQAESPKQPAGKIVYVPQGRSARLTRDSLACGVSGLYTDGFSSCYLLICIGENKLFLVHADRQLSAKAVLQPCLWIYHEIKEVVMVYKEEYRTLLADKIEPAYRKFFERKIFATKSMGSDCSGILLSFDRPMEIFPPNQYPENVIRHPREQKLLTVQKIQQVIGLRAAGRNPGAVKLKTINLFDGFAWEPVSEDELRVDDSDPYTKDELKLFLPSDDYTLVGSKLLAVTDASQAAGIPQLETARFCAAQVAPYLQWYLSERTADELFKKDIKVLFDQDSEYSIFDVMKPVSADDKKMCKDMTKQLKSAEGIIKLFHLYRDKAEATVFKKELLENFDTLYRAYNERKKYESILTEREVLKKRAGSLLEKASVHYKKQEWSAAKDLFFDALKLSIECYTKDEPLLASAFWNYGRTLQKAGSYVEARFFIQIAITLRETYRNVLPSDIAIIKSNKTALAECEKMTPASVDSKTAVAPPGQ